MDEDNEGSSISMCWKLSSASQYKAGLDLHGKKLAICHLSDNHPLQAAIDPLRDILEGSDPLADPLNVKDLKDHNMDLGNVSSLNKDRSWNWNDYQTYIFDRFHTKQRLTLASSFLTSSETGVVKVQSNIPDRTRSSKTESVRARLEQLECLDDSALFEMGGLTQDQFIQHLMALKDEMKDAWNSELRVKALKIAIQCVKSLAISSPEIFYPYKFMIITDILDSLVILVFNRLLQILNTPSSPIRNLSHLEAAETACNWFCKVASIRELLPRLYLEASLIKCYSVLDEKNTEDVLLRLIKSCRGIGDPIVGAYARMYIVKIGLQESPAGDSQYIRLAIEDLVTCINWGWGGLGIEKIEVMKEDVNSSSVIAERVFSQPLKWILHCYSQGSSSAELQDILKLGDDLKGTLCYVFNSALLKTFPKFFISASCLTICRSIQRCFKFGEHPHEIMIALAEVVNEEPPSDNVKMELLNIAWNLVTLIQDINNYLKAASAWVHYIAIYFTWEELDVVMREILKRLSKFTATDSHGFYSSLLSLITTALSFFPDSEKLCNLATFQGLLTIFHRDTLGSGSVGRSRVGVEEMKKLLTAAIAHHPNEFSDPTIIRIFLSLFSSLHDGMNALTTEDEKRQVAKLVNAFIGRVNYGSDFERQLEFYVDSRAAFARLDSVLEELVQLVCRLQVQTVKGRHASRIASFQRACTAYSFITIPSLSSSSARLKLYLLCGTIALVNNCMGQGDACIKSAIKELIEISSEMSSNCPLQPPEELVAAVCNLSSCLIAIPDPPGCSEPLYLFRGLSNAVKSFNFLDSVWYCKINLAVMKGICCTCRPTLPYYLRDVEANDTLYGGDVSLREQAERLCSELLAQILVNIQNISSTPQSVQISFLCDFIQTVFIYGDLNDLQIRNLASGLLLLIGKHKKSLTLQFDTKLKRLTT